MLIAVLLVAAACRADLPAGASLIDGNLIGDLNRPGAFAISDNGDRIAYTSRGALWLAEARGGPPTKLADLPDTRTDFLRETDYATARSRFNVIGAKERAEDFRPPHDRPSTRFYGLKWSSEQDGVFYALANNRREGADHIFEHRYFCASIERGTVSKLATIVRGGSDKIHVLDAFEVTLDREALVLFQFGHPLIWDIAAGRARVTPYDFLTASSTSGRFLGVEIDTGQLVVTNDRLQIEKRVDYRLPAKRRGFRFFWSPDERYAVVVVPLPHPAIRAAVAIRIEIATGRTRRLAGGTKHDRFAFTGNGGEVVRWGVPRGNRAWRPDGRDASQVMLIPDGDAVSERLAQHARPYNVYGKHHQPWRIFQPVVLNRDASRFVMAVPRPDDRPGFRCRLHDRRGRQWALGPDDPTLYVSPYRVLGFVARDKRLLASDDTRLFSIPLETLQRVDAPPIEAKEATDE